MAVPVIRQLKAWALPGPGQHIIVDCPPGTSCPVVAAMRSADYLVLVTEPTPFGLHDLRLAVQVAHELGLPAGVIVNRDNGSYPDLEAFCRSSGLPILLRVPFKREIAEGIAQGKNLVEIRPDYRERFWQMYNEIAKGSGA